MSSSAMPACHGHNEACCNIPPVVASGYAAKGSYEQLGSLKTYVTGPATATKGIISVYDIFGYADQTVQGADILAYGDESHQYKVFMPDWFKGNPCPVEWFPPDTEEKQKNVGAFFSNPDNAPQAIAAALPEYVKALELANPSIKSWGLIGYCWGGKIAALATSSASNPFKIAASPHPAMVDPADAKGITVPFALLASAEEPVETVKEFEGNLAVPHHVETFGDQVHGFMAARADLADPRVEEEYTRGYKAVLEFFGKHWQ
ncbi:Alpha/Beta hydrolase protein [Chaetomium fimeti]|uniref:Alpha/Beta hydrolase protein n=1 Tax=Chaetomium fimeti TaxID=1854472 RepID=A0AAE0HNC3_9PEZI|nr:Alpha/Beta hydrolase protein [Chaetomium fimeti]